MTNEDAKRIVNLMIMGATLTEAKACSVEDYRMYLDAWNSNQEDSWQAIEAGLKDAA